ncbi:MAG: putative glycosidase [Myxococcaceae bacterium]|nr:putative glycosidase [Myxococcaceae bacterium]
MLIRIEGDRFVDEHRRTLLLRGVNLGGSSKLPRAEGSFVGRPFPLDEADEHFSRLQRWGLTTLRLVVTWEAIEHAGPRKYDLAYLDYLEALIRRAATHQLAVFIDFHQDVWSRFSGGDGAPGWTLEAAGFNLDTLHETGAAFVEAKHAGPLPKMIWPTNAGKLGSATMFTLFFGGDTFAPRTRIDGESAQRFLQEHFFGAVEQVVRRVASLPNVFGVDLLNEPSPGYIGWEDLEAPGGPVEVGVMPSPLQSMAPFRSPTISSRPSTPRGRRGSTASLRTWR